MSSRTEPPGSDAELVAYLDGELEPADSRAFEERLATDPELQLRLREHQRVWELLDELPRAASDPGLVHTTVEMVAVSAASAAFGDGRSAKRGRAMLRVTLVTSALLIAAIAGYALTRFALRAPDRMLLRDLPIIENLDAYQSAERIDFLRALDREGLFALEEDYGP